jgi:hypothetical protein
LGSSRLISPISPNPINDLASSPTVHLRFIPGALPPAPQSRRIGASRLLAAKSRKEITIMKSTQTLNLVKLAACAILLVGLSASALASCGDSMAAMASAAASVHSQSGQAQQSLQPGSAAASDNAANPSIVGLWHIFFTAGGQTIQEAYQLWNVGGTEVHNPNVDPRTGNVCLGVWKGEAPRAYKLAHRVWWYDAGGNFLGTIHLSETLTLGDNGNTHSGTFTLDFYDPSGNFLFEVAGNVSGERISVE